MSMGRLEKMREGHIIIVIGIVRIYRDIERK